MINIKVIGTLVLALANIICGISAIVFNKYPGRKGGLKEIQKKYGDVSEKKLSKFEGARFIVFGIMWIIMSMMHIKKSVILAKIIICICIILFPLYFIGRHKIFSKK